MPRCRYRSPDGDRSEIAKPWDAFESERAYRKWDRDWQRVSDCADVFIHLSFALAGYSLLFEAGGWFAWFLCQAASGIVVSVLTFAYRLRRMR